KKANKTGKVMIIASLISVISSIVGLYYSYIYNIHSGATIVLCTFVIYIITLFFTKFTNRKKRGSLT
ncbi:metal ABC transporter permease, partial [Staphylococcus aureus]